MSSGRITVALDTMTLVWGIARKGDEEMLTRTKNLFTQLKKDEARIIVPAIVAAEYLAFVEEERKLDVLASISKNFQVVPFDIKCAFLASRLWNQNRGTRKKGVANSRICLKADTQIVACAKTFGAKRFYSNDKDCRALAEKAKLEAFDIPAFSEFLIEP